MIQTATEHAHTAQKEIVKWNSCEHVDDFGFHLDLSRKNRINDLYDSSLPVFLLLGKMQQKYRKAEKILFYKKKLFDRTV